MTQAQEISYFGELSCGQIRPRKLSLSSSSLDADLNKVVNILLKNSINCDKQKKHLPKIDKCLSFRAPEVGLEPTTL